MRGLCAVIHGVFAVICGGAFFGVILASAQVPDRDLPLMPWPAQVTPTSGKFLITQTFTAVISGAGSVSTKDDTRVRDGATRALYRLFRETGIPISLTLADEKASPSLSVVVERKKPGIQKLGDDESYRLSITPDRVRIVATEPLGALRGLETFLQLVRISSSGFSAPAVEIDDHPRFGWRGLSLDVSRHFIGVDGIKRTIDGLAAVKMNVLHWHLSDDQGFRIESKKYPRLQEKGSDGQFYTQAEVREIIAYARDRGVRVVPEFDMPGHATSWFPGYPSLASGKGPYEMVREPGVLTATMDPTKESTYKFLDGFIGEMAKLFPDAYFHIGGDEVSPRGEWYQNPHIAAFMKKHRLADFPALQAYFNRRVLKIVTKHGKHMEGWDEILHPDLPKSSLIQSWRGKKSLAEAARQGYSGILSAGYYLDLMQPAAQHYAVDPLKDADPSKNEVGSLTAEEQRRVLGGEAAMWEEIATMENIDVKLWPRVAAIAERFWSPQDVTDVASMYRRLEATSHWLDLQGLQHLSEIRLMQARLAGSFDPAPLAVLASILEPMKGYSRHRTQKFSSIFPFNRLVDAIPPESDAAREFRDAVDRVVGASQGDPRSDERGLAGDGPAPLDGLAGHGPAPLDYVRARLTEWRRNTAAVLPVLQSNSLLAEDIDVANAVAELCSIGLEALGPKPDAARVQAMLAAIEADSKPKAEMLIQIAPGILKLVQRLQ
jgi:hexosaminidase